LLIQAVYIFVGCVIVGSTHWYRWVPGTIVGIIGIGYVVLEYIPSIEPPANMRYASSAYSDKLASACKTLTRTGRMTQTGAPSKSNRPRNGLRLSARPQRLSYPIDHPQASFGISKSCLCTRRRFLAKEYGNSMGHVHILADCTIFSCCLSGLRVSYFCVL